MLDLTQKQYEELKAEADKLPRLNKPKSIYPIGKNKRSLNRDHKKFFTYDSDNKVKSYKYAICIDKAVLKAYLKLDEIEGILNSFKYRTEKVTDEFTRYYIDMSSTLGVHIVLEPYQTVQPTAKITLHPKFTNNHNGNSPIILDILNRHTWYLRRLDIAIDYVTPYSRSASFKRHGRQSKKNYKTGEQTGSSKNPNAMSLTSHYDRYENDNSIDTDFINRFEVKLMFQMKERVTFANLDHSKIAMRLRKELFIPHLHFAMFNKSNKEHIEKEKKQGNEWYYKENLTKKQRENLRKEFKNFRDCIEDYYLENCHLIYDFLLAHQ